MPVCTTPPVHHNYITLGYELKMIGYLSSHPLVAPDIPVVCPVSPGGDENPRSFESRP